MEFFKKNKISFEAGKSLKRISIMAYRVIIMLCDSAMVIKAFSTFCAYSDNLKTCAMS